MNYAEIGRKGGQATRGSQKGTAKLTEEQALEVLTSSESCYQMAKRLGVNRSTLTSIRAGKAWRHLR